MAKIIFGCGYLGSRVAERWQAAGEEVYAVTRSSDRAREFVARGWRPIVADLAAGPSGLKLPVVDTALFCVGHGRSPSLPIEQAYPNAIGSALDALADNLSKFIFTSSTGVYGQTDGGWVDENSPCEPLRPGGLACLAAEKLLASHPLGARAIVLRLAGLYGPGRIPNAADVRSGRPIAAPASGYLNLIHVDDAATIVLAAAERAAPPRTYVVSDGQPVARRDYHAELCRLLGAPRPVFASPEPDSPAAQRAGSDKRVDNRRMIAELSVRLAYPSYREGLAAIVATTRANESSR